MLPSSKAGSHRRDHSGKGQLDSLTLAQAQFIKLHQSENAWIPTRKIKEYNEGYSYDLEEMLKRNVQSVLNKLTCQKFQILLNQLKSFKISTEADKQMVADLIYKNAIYEPHFGKLYANMCKHSIMVAMSFSEDWKCIMTILLSKCHQEFEKHCNAQNNKIETSQDKEAEETTESCRNKAKRLANIRFIGELFKVKFIMMPVTMKYIEIFLVNQDEESLECFYMFLKTAGKELVDYANGSEKDKVDDYFIQIQNIINLHLTTTRMTFLLQDILDMRNNNWIPRRIENVPKTIDEIHEEAIIEQRKQWPWHKNKLYFAAQKEKQDQTKTHTNRNTCFCESEKPTTTINNKKDEGLSRQSESSTVDEARKILAAEYGKVPRNSAKKRVKKKSSQIKSKNNTDSKDSGSKPS